MFLVAGLLNVCKIRTIWYKVNSLPNDKILAWSKLKAVADDKIDIKMISLLERVENIVGKGENTGYKHFLLFHSVFQTLLS